MYSVDGIALHNPGMDWKFRGPSRPLSDLTLQRTSLRVPGMPGVVADVEDALASLDSPTPTLMVRTPNRHYDALLSLLAEGSVLTRADRVGREARFELLSTSHEGFGPADAVIDVAATIRLPGVFWRDVDETTVQVSIDAASVLASAWAMTGLVTDAVVRVRGPVSGLLIRSGRDGKASIRYTPAIASGSYLRYESATGRSFLTTSNVWTGGTDVSGAVQADGPGDKFAIFPARVSPFEKVAQLQVDTATRGTGAVIEIRGKAAHLG